MAQGWGVQGAAAYPVIVQHHVPGRSLVVRLHDTVVPHVVVGPVDGKPLAHDAPLLGLHVGSLEGTIHLKGRVDRLLEQPALVAAHHVHCEWARALALNPGMLSRLERLGEHVAVFRLELRWAKRGEDDHRDQA